MMTTTPRILIIASDLPFGKLLARELERRELRIELRSDIADIPDQLRQSRPDLLIIDLNVSVAETVATLKNIRVGFRELPVLVLSSSNRAEDLEQAFEHGADDFLGKPVSLRELAARSRRLLRRKGISMESPQKSNPLTIHPEGLTVYRGGQQIDLTPKEFAILEYLAKNAGKIVSRQALMQEFWKASADGSTNVVDVYMKYLRDKIDRGHEEKIIRTVRGFGYVLKGEECQYA